MSNHGKASPIMAQDLHTLVLGVLAILAGLTPATAHAKTVLLARTAVVVSGRPSVLECRHDHEERRDQVSAFSRGSRDVVTLELLDGALSGPATHAATPNIVWHMESETSFEPRLYARTLRASLAQFAEGRVRFVLSWIGADPRDHLFFRCEIYDVGLERVASEGLGPEHAFVRRSHEPLAALQRLTTPTWTFTGDTTVLLSPLVVQVRFATEPALWSMCEYDLRRQQWYEATVGSAPVVSEEPIPQVVPMVLRPEAAREHPASSTPIPSALPPARETPPHPPR